MFFNSFGYNGTGSNLFSLDSGEIAYYVGIFVVLWDPVANVQRHYSEHTEEITWYVYQLINFLKIVNLKN